MSDQCVNCGNKLTEVIDDEPREPCNICGSFRRKMSLKFVESVIVSDIINVNIASYISKRNYNNCLFKYKIGKDNLNIIFSNFDSLKSNSNQFIYLHDCFVHGNQTANLIDGKLLDYKNLDTYKIYLTKFLEDLFINKILIGKNKPSWEKSNGGVVLQLQDYWHYHCGPYGEGQSHKTGVIQNLNFRNPNGKTSSPVIHYIQTTNEKMETLYIIVGFAIEHDKPFNKKNRIEK